MSSKLVCIFALAIGLAFTSSALADGSTFSAYSIGNSLSEDMWRVFPTLAAAYQNGQVPSSNYSWGAHFRAGTSLTYMYANPTAASTYSAIGLSAGVSTPSTNAAPWNTALPNNAWNAVTMEPYPSYNETYGSVTLATDTTAANGMIDKAHNAGRNASTRFFIYAAWPSVTFGDYNSYSNAYLAPSTHLSGENSDLSKAYITDLFNSVHATHADISMIPVGEVLYAIDQKMQQGKISGFSSIEQLHRDAIHLNGLGQNVAAATVYACLFKQDPTGLDYVSIWPDTDASLSSHLPSQFLDSSGHVAVNDPVKMAALQADLRIMQQTVWEVVNQNSFYTNVPEPATGIVVLGGMTLLGMRRRAAMQYTASAR